MPRHAYVNNFFFFILNQIMLPLAGISTIYGFFEYLASMELADWPETLASNISPSGSFFLRYIIQVSLISNTFQLLSLPKLFWDFINTHTWYMTRLPVMSENTLAMLYKKSAFNISNYCPNNDIVPDELDNSFYFDIAYQQAFSISIFTMVFLFSKLIITHLYRHKCSIDFTIWMSFLHIQIFD
jgi:hypothetical protein